jgi:hypothetical protein
MGVYLTGVHLMGVHLTGHASHGRVSHGRTSLCLMGMRLIGMYLIDVYFMGKKLRAATPERPGGGGGGDTGPSNLGTRAARIYNAGKGQQKRRRPRIGARGKRSVKGGLSPAPVKME